MGGIEISKSLTESSSSSNHDFETNVVAVRVD